MKFQDGAEPVPDVVIAGYGPAGAAAAIAAHDAGRGVLVLESAERGGGNARYSGGFLFDVPDDAAVAHLDALCFGRTDRRVLGAYAPGAVSLAWGHLIERPGDALTPGGNLRT